MFRDNPTLLALAIIYLQDNANPIRQRYPPIPKFEDEFLLCDGCDCPRWCRRLEICYEEKLR